MSGTTLILGAGFGGIAAANALRGLVSDDHQILVVDQSERFVVGAGKTWLMLGERTLEEISQRREALLSPGVRFVLGQVTGLDIANRSATVSGAAQRWDQLVIAIGADLDMESVPGLAAAAHTFYTVEGAERLEPALERFAGGDLVLLIPKVPFKCPPAPYEAAMLLRHAFERRGIAARARIAIHTIEGAPMATAGPEMGRLILDELGTREIAFHPERKAARVDGAARRVFFEDGAEAGYDLLIAVPPHVAPKVVRDAGLAGPGGFIPVDPRTLRVSAASGEVYAIGDITSVPLPGRFKPEVALSLPKAGVFAEAQGRVVAQQIAATILGRSPGELFDGKGYCFLEVGSERAIRAEGSFFELPHPVMRAQAADPGQLRDKQDWVARHLRPTG